MAEIKAVVHRPISGPSTMLKSKGVTWHIHLSFGGSAGSDQLILYVPRKMPPSWHWVNRGAMSGGTISFSTVWQTQS